MSPTLRSIKSSTSSYSQIDKGVNSRFVEQELNIEIEKLIGPKQLKNNTIRFLCKWEGYSNEDVTYCITYSLKASLYSIQFVILGFHDLTKDLRV